MTSTLKSKRPQFKVSFFSEDTPVGSREFFLTSPSSPTTTLIGSVRMSRQSISTFFLNVALNSKADGKIREKKLKTCDQQIQTEAITRRELTLPIWTNIAGDGSHLRFWKQQQHNVPNNINANSVQLRFLGYHKRLFFILPLKVLENTFLPLQNNKVRGTRLVEC